MRLLGPAASQCQILPAASEAIGKLRLYAVQFDRSDRRGVGYRRFAQLYLESTLLWEELFRQSDVPVFGGLLIKRFFSLFEKYVVLPGNNKRPEVVRHWKPFFYANAQPPRPVQPLASLMCLFLAIRAHVRYDLAEAILQAHKDYLRLYGRAPDMNLCRTIVLGPASGDLFWQAMHNFLTQGKRPSVGESAAVTFLQLTGRIWLPVFQSWRRAAWSDAMRAIETGVPLRRD